MLAREKRRGKGGRRKLGIRSEELGIGEE